MGYRSWFGVTWRPLTPGRHQDDTMPALGPPAGTRRTSAAKEEDEEDSKQMRSNARKTSRDFYARSTGERLFPVAAFPG